MDTVTAYVLGVATGLILLPIFWLLLRAVGPWITAHASGAGIPFFHFVGMRLRGTDLGMVINLHTVLTKLGEPVPPNQRNADALLRAVRPDLAEKTERSGHLQGR
jgi:uncharacterized protein YqfA (UPF0365 family)